MKKLILIGLLVLGLNLLNHAHSKPKKVSACQGTITIIAPHKPSNHADDAAHFRIQATKGVGEIYDLFWNRTMTIRNLCLGQYLIITNPSGKHPSQTPQQLELSASNPDQRFKLSYLPAQAKIAVKVEIKGLNLATLTPEVIYKSKSDYGKVTLGQNQKTSIELIAGEHYQLWMPTMIRGNIAYLANYSENHPLEFSTTETALQTVGLTIQQKTLTNLNIELNIAGALNNDERFDLSAIGAHGQIYTYSNLSPGRHRLQMVADNYRFKIKKQGEGQIQVQNVVVAQEQEPININIQSSAGTKKIVGYLTTAWGSMVKISDAAKAGYNIVVLAFTELDQDLKVKFNHQQFQAYTLWQHRVGLQDIEAIKADVNLAKKYGLQHVLISFDGGKGSFTPKSMNIKTIANNMIKFIHEYQFDGIDFDLESIGANVSQQDFLNLIQEIRKIDATIILSCAPELSIINNQLTYVNRGQDQLYNPAIKQGYFDYIFVQEYNSPGYFVKQDGKTCVIDKPGCFDETSPRFIVASFPALKRLTPTKTLIFPGQPAAQSSAGLGSIYHGSKQKNIYQEVENSYQELNIDPQYGGPMVWNINDDFNNDFEFVNTAKKNH